ncbi:FG-GAP repeat domain-containing protein [Pseudoalteromonas sp. PPB1]|uniref:FG-GAP repeat domain-containing protein n=1 Tax=Pseudoalteromonas sp. PPB1 TaxID=2756136 RepID=UPI001891BE1F|nr:VCBS repeat-containing protein [Pseudoalteromonas sp. PPB1]
MYKNWMGIMTTACVLSACGGGGDSPKSAPKSELGLQTLSDNPSGDSPQRKIQAVYDGKKEPVQIGTDNFMQITHDVLYWRDVAQFIVNTDSRNFTPRYPKFKQYHNGNYWLPDDQLCESGKATLPQFENETALKPSYDVVYENCKVGPLIANGQATLHLIGPDVASGRVEKLAIELLSGFSIHEQSADQTYQVQGYSIESQYERSKSVSMVFSQDGKKLAWVDYGEGAEHYDNVYLAKYGKVSHPLSSVIVDEQGGEIHLQHREDEIWIALTQPQEEYFFELNNWQRNYFYSGGKDDARWIAVANSDFNLTTLLADNGPTQVRFDAKNVVKQGEQVTLRPYFIDAPDYNLSKVTWHIKAPGVSEPVTDSQWEKEYTFEQSGEYLVTLIATDTHNNSAQFSETIYVTGGSTYLGAEVSIEVESDLTEQTPYRAKIGVAEKGTYQFALASGPAGMTVDEAGVVSWDGQQSATFQFADSVHYSVKVTNTESQGSELISGKIVLMHTPKQLESLYHLSGDTPAKALSWKNPGNANRSMLLSSEEASGAGITSLTLQDETLVVESNLFQTPTKGKVLNVTYSGNAEELVYLYAHEYDYSRLVNFKVSTDEAHVFNPENSLHRIAPYITDLDNDGELEIVNTYSVRGVELYNSSYERSVAELVNGMTGYTSYSKWQECDLDGDGTAELLQTVSNSSSVQLNLISYADKQFRAVNSALISNESYYRDPIANMIDLDGDGRCEGIISYVGTAGNASLGWHVYDGETLVLEHTSDEYSEMFDYEHEPFAVNYSALIFKSHSTMRTLSYNPQELQFTTSPLTFSTGLDIQLNPAHSTLVGRADLDNDGTQEWVYKHVLSPLDALYSELGEHYGSDYNFTAHDIVYVAANVKQGLVTPKYRSKAISIASVIGVLPDGSGATRVVTERDEYSQVRYYTEIDTQGKITPQSREEIAGVQVVYRDDGSYYRFDSYDNTYALYDAGDKVMHTGVCTFYSCFLDTDQSIRRVTGSHQGIDIVAEPGEHNFLLIDTNAKQVHRYNEHSDIGITHLVPHPDFNNNGLIFVKEKNPHRQTNLDDSEPNKFDILDSGVYRITRNGMELVHSWKDKVFSQHSDYTYAAVWMNTDADPELEIVHYIQSEYHSSYDDTLEYSFSADSNGDNVTYHKYLSYLNIGSKSQQGIFEQACIEQSCRESVIRLVESDEGTQLSASDRLTGLPIWSRNIASSNLQGQVLYYDKERIYFKANGLHVIR